MDYSLLIPVLTPLVIAFAKFLAPRLPGRWLPVAAPAVGAILDAITAHLHGHPITPVVGAILGLAGVGVREVVDQWGQRLTATLTKAGTAALIIALIVTAPGLAIGCSTLKSHQSEVKPDGTKTEQDLSLRSLWDGKSELQKYRASQTDKTQSTSVGSAGTETSSTNSVSLIDKVAARVVEKLAGP